MPNWGPIMIHLNALDLNVEISGVNTSQPRPATGPQWARMQPKCAKINLPVFPHILNFAAAVTAPVHSSVSFVSFVLPIGHNNEMLTILRQICFKNGENITRKNCYISSSCGTVAAKFF